MSEFRWAGKVALVTGGNSGIGAAITRRLLELGLIVVVLDRNIDDLQELATKDEVYGRLYPRICDLRHENDVLETFRWIETCLGGVDVLVNNAGITGHNSLVEGSPDEWRHLLEVNVVALCLCTKEAVASMRRRNIKDGHIFNLSSTLAHTIHPYGPLHFYTATKYAVSALTEGVRQELRETKARIRVTVNEIIIKPMELLA
ncbi:dehydrogenase/reductase SDR family member 11-like isoform X2 [Cryptotermes secundus]|uniref:dehydrogenase/reductase SDR family member 11-like isoform X2 n=1 Tax=Cryptotermes secundus TaxID=105785 RepID=UPI000CD7CD13|nr:dehydrogenase/reductase SDR family member 11-like isoform X2 [Cryptotermes secundus]